MNFFKTFIVGVAVSIALQANALVVTGQIADATFPENTIILTTNRVNAYSVELTATANSLVNFYDIDVTNAPYYGTNYVNASYVSRTAYATNVVGTFVGYNGFTNWYTNQGIFTLTVTNAANTNALAPLFSASIGANTLTTYSVDALFVRGLVAVATKGTNINIVVNYRSGQ
jgi:hypothetical protein